MEVASQHLYDKRENGALLMAIRALVQLVTLKESGFKMLLQGWEVVNEGTGLSANAEEPSQNSQLSRGPEERTVNALKKFGQDVRYNLGAYRPAPDSCGLRIARPQEMKLLTTRGLDY